MADPASYESLLAALEDRVLRGAGALDIEVREASALSSDGDGDVPPALAPLVDKIRLHAYKVTDGDIERLQAEGYTDDQLFELIVAVAVGEGVKRIGAGLRAVEAT